MAEALHRPRAILFDVGNTLSYLDHDALSHIAGQVGSPVSAQALARAEAVAKRRYEQILRQGASHEGGWLLYMQAIFEAGGLSERDATRAADAAKAEHARFNLWRKVPDGLIAGLRRARAAGIRLGIVSNSEGALLSLLERVELSEHFETVVDSGLVGVRKPDPAIFQLALTRMALAPDGVLYAGDIPEVDVVGARAAGLDAVLIDTLDHYPDYRDAPRFVSALALLDALGV
jgi:HAD superfamily hydrolase (TIGR01509 family)